VRQISQTPNRARYRSDALFAPDPPETFLVAPAIFARITGVQVGHVIAAAIEAHLQRLLSRLVGIPPIVGPAREVGIERPFAQERRRAVPQRERLARRAAAPWFDRW